jgi:hypothetical protein
MKRLKQSLAASKASVHKLPKLKGSENILKMLQKNPYNVKVS